MASSPPLRSILALRACDLFPPSIQDALISDYAFQSSYELTADSRISFGGEAVSFQSSKLFDCIRNLLGDASDKATLLDEAGEDWAFAVLDVDSVQRITVCRAEHRFMLPDFYYLSSDPTVRVTRFDREAEEVDLPNDASTKWRHLLTSRSLLDNEVDQLLKELGETPIRVMKLIRSEMEIGKGNLSTLVPNSKQYYERLVGEYAAQRDIAEYAQTGARDRIQHLMSWRPLDGFLRSLLLSSHSVISSTIETGELNEILISAYEWLKDHGDRISQVGAIEIGLRILDRVPPIEPAIKAMVESFRNDDPEDSQSRLHLCSSLIMLVDGELSRTKILRGTPPFWRRMASIAQASVIERCIVEALVGIAPFSEWASQARGQQFYLQTLVDMRQEPRWLPDYVSPSQLKAEFISRITAAARLNDDKIHDAELRELLLGNGPTTLQSMNEFPYAYLVGPLEGGSEAQLEPPSELLNAIEEQLSTDVLTPLRFAVLVNSAMIFRLGPNHALLAAKALRSAKHQLREVNSDLQLSNTLRGVAIVAAVTRSAELSEELRVLVRRCRRERGNDLSIAEATAIGLIAAAAFADLGAWSHFVGEWLTELAFESSQPDGMRTLLYEIRRLCQIAPQLWFTCGRAEAALIASLAVTPAL